MKEDLLVLMIWEAKESFFDIVAVYSCRKSIVSVSSWWGSVTVVSGKTKPIKWISL